MQRVLEQPVWRQGPALALLEMQQASQPQEQLVQPLQVRQAWLLAVLVEREQQAVSPDVMVAVDDVAADCEQHSNCECGS